MRRLSFGGRVLPVSAVEGKLDAAEEVGTEVARPGCDRGAEEEGKGCVCEGALDELGEVLS